MRPRIELAPGVGLIEKLKFYSNLRTTHLSLAYAYLLLLRHEALTGRDIIVIKVLEATGAELSALSNSY